jgi:hypothetical protein
MSDRSPAGTDFAALQPVLPEPHLTREAKRLRDRRAPETVDPLLYWSRQKAKHMA